MPTQKRQSQEYRNRIPESASNKMLHVFIYTSGIYSPADLEFLHRAGRPPLPESLAMLHHAWQQRHRSGRDHLRRALHPEVTLKPQSRALVFQNCLFLRLLKGASPFTCPSLIPTELHKLPQPLVRVRVGVCPKRQGNSRHALEILCVHTTHTSPACCSHEDLSSSPQDPHKEDRAALLWQGGGGNQRLPEAC